MKLKCPICSGTVNKKSGICKSCGYFINRSTESVNYEVDSIDVKAEEKSEFEPVKLCENCNSANKITAIMCRTCGESLTNSKIIRNEDEEYIDVKKRIDYGWFDNIFNNRLFTNKIFKTIKITFALLFITLYILNYITPVIMFNGYKYRSIHYGDRVHYLNIKIGRNIKIIDKGDYKEVLYSDVGKFHFNKKNNKLMRMNDDNATSESSLEVNIAQLKSLCLEFENIVSNGNPFFFVAGVMMLLIGLFHIRHPEMVYQIRYFISAYHAQPSDFFLNMTRIAGMVWLGFSIVVIIFSYGEFF